MTADARAWWFDPRRTYEDNVAHGPFHGFGETATGLSGENEDAGAATSVRADARIAPPAPRAGQTFLGIDVRTAFGIAAGPLPTARHCAAAFREGFDVNVYKTVRTHAVHAHPFPNALAVRAPGDLPAGGGATVLAERDVRDTDTITNSYGVPSPDPDVWQPDMAAAAAAAGPGQVLVGSCQGTRSRRGVDALVADFARVAELTAETGVRALELNLSCPNEGAGALVCHDVPLVTRIGHAVRERVPDVPLVLKVARFEDDAALGTLVRAAGAFADGIAAINTLAARIVDADGRPALPGDGREVAGVCGRAIRWAGLDMVRRLARHRDESQARLAIVGVGGVLSVDDVSGYRGAGADAVMCATGAMRDPGLGRAVVQERARAASSR